MTNKIINKHSTIKGSRPTAAFMEPGEIALNLHAQTPGLYFRDTEGSIRKIGPAHVSETAPPQASVGEMWLNPLNGYSIKVFNGTAWQECGAVSYISENPPEQPSDGQMWFDLVSSDLKVYVAEQERWVGQQEDSQGISASNLISLGTGNSPYEIFVDFTSGTDSFTNSGTDQRLPFRTLNRALLEAAKRSILPGQLDDYDKILIRCRNGSNVVFNRPGASSLEDITLARNWGDPTYQRFLDGSSLLLANVDWIAGKSFNALNSAYRTSSETPIDTPTTMEVKGFLRGAVEAVAQDLRSGGNSHTTFFAKGFYDGNGVLTAFTDLLVKDLFVTVAIPELRARCLLAIQNRGAFVDDTISADLAAEGAEELCFNVQSAVSTLLDLFSRVLRGSLLLEDVPVQYGTFPSEPSEEELVAFNDPLSGGLIIPRGVSIQGADLRKTAIVPAFVPSSTLDRGDSIFKFTGGSFFFNFTFKDNPEAKRSHHQLRCFSFASESQLALYYQKVTKAFGLSNSDVEIAGAETDIVFSPGKIDSVDGSSPYVFNCSVRSEYGLSGIEADGSAVGGLKSVVSAQFTNVSLQTDPDAWEVYNGESKDWRPAQNYQEVIDTPVESVRFRESYRGFAFRAKNSAYMQLVSCFVIGDAVHYWSMSGGDISITNSTSNFGGTSCIAEGFSGIRTIGGALEQDSDFAVEGIIRPESLPISTAENGARRIRVGVISSIVSSAAYNEIFLEENLFLSYLNGFSIEPDGIIYTTDSSGVELSSLVISDAATIFPNRNPQNSDDLGNVIRIKKNNDGISSGFSVEGRELYFKRYIDYRALPERTYKLRVKTTKVGTRRPQINFIFRLISGGSVGQVQTIASGAQFDPANGDNQVFFIANVEDVLLPSGEVDNDTFDLTLLSLDSFQEFDPEKSFALGDTTLYEHRLYRSLKSRNLGKTPNTEKEWWEPIRYQQFDTRGLHQEAQYAAVRLILNKDNGTLGMGLTREDYDDPTQNLSYQTIYRVLELLGYSESTITSVLTPQLPSNRVYNPINLPAPVGGAALQSNNWPVEFNRPSLIRASGHTWEWVGYYNYTKAIPNNQNSTLSLKNREAAIYAELYGGRVYSNGLTEEGEVFENGHIVVRQSEADSSLDFDPVNTGVVSKVLSLQVGTCEVPGDNWLATNNLRLCGNLRLESGAQIENRHVAPPGVQASWGNGVVGESSGILYGLARPSSYEEAFALLSTDTFITPATLRELTRESLVGSIGFFPSLTVDDRFWLPCDGALRSKNDLLALYNFLRGVFPLDSPLSASPATSPWGESGGSFYVPNLYGKFIRGWGEFTTADGRFVSSDGIGSVQLDSFRSHAHGVNLSDPGHQHAWDSGRSTGSGSAGAGSPDNEFNSPTSVNTTGITVSIQESGGAETRPVNVALFPCIRYR